MLKDGFALGLPIHFGEVGLLSRNEKVMSAERVANSLSLIPFSSVLSPRYSVLKSILPYDIRLFNTPHASIIYAFKILVLVGWVEERNPTNGGSQSSFFYYASRSYKQDNLFFPGIQIM